MKRSRLDEPYRETMNDKGLMMFVLGITLGDCLVQGVAYVCQNYLWVFFYSG